VTRLSTRAQRRLAWAGWAIVPLGYGNSAGPLAEMPAQHCAAIFFDFYFSFQYFRNCINFKNA
jgi:hypothetical protein